METRIDEVADRIYRLSAFVPEPLSGNQTNVR
jgi:hypothetical protein